jgi:hypothetical protein
MTRCFLVPGLAALGLLYLLAVGGRVVRAADPAPEVLDFFEKKVRPVLVEHCQRCHSPKDKVRGGLRLDTRAMLLKGGDGGPVVVPGHPEKSRLVEAIRYTNSDLQMPPRGKLSPAAIADLTRWVQMGAPWPKEDTTTVARTGGFDLAQRKARHWSWQPIRPQQPPPVKDRAWCRSPVDAFILAGLEAKGLEPAPAAERRTWFRRVTLALAGLPPTPEEIDAFLNDSSPDAAEKVVDRLLASPRFGERWARHWLDLVRYAETRGHEFDPNIPNAYQYRDYVIRAFNAGVPYDRFVLEHLAGDLLPDPRRHPATGSNESILGTGFWFLGEEVHSPVDVRQDQADRYDNRIDVLSRTFLGLTVACARCHDHKFDAISQKDYYALFGFLESSHYRLARFDSLDRNRAVAAELARIRDKARTEIGKALAGALRPAAERLPAILLAAREAILARSRFVSAPARGEEQLRQIAAARRLDATLLNAWVKALLKAELEPGDPFRAWARVCAEPAARDEKRLAELIRLLADELRRLEGTEWLPRDDQVVVDLTRPAPGGWIQDEAAFGVGPTRAGDVRLSGEAARPDVRFVVRPAAEYDRAFDVLRLAPDAENDNGALGQMTLRAGRTLCTPTFKIAPGRVHYLVKGKGAAYASVSAHTVIAGPLHAQLVLNFSGGNDYRWYSQDLSRYQGLAAHIEFTAAAGSDFAVALVVQGPEPPRPVPLANPGLLRLLTNDTKSLETLAAGYGRWVAELAKRLAADEVVGSAQASDLAGLADWWLRHPELLGEPAKTIRETAAACLAEQHKVAAGIQAESRLAVAALDGDGVDERVFLRGSPKVEGEPAPRRLLEALAGPRPLEPFHGSGRLQLAQQIIDPKVTPFVARVYVNRIWHHLFGRGIVASVDDFGFLGERPTHPELLDHLADRFVREGWSTKKLIRELVLSATYRMSSHPSPEGDRLDPGNLLLHRMRLRRLEGEVIRDSMLALSGRLDGTLYGPSVPIHLTPFLDGRGRPGSGPLDGNGRRSIYLAVRRNFLSPLLLAFDTPAPFSTMGRRSVSNVPAQALILMNDPFVHQQAGEWARQVVARPGSTATRITEMYVSAFGRPPGAEERAACEAFLRRQAEQNGGKVDDPRVWAELAHTLFNVKDFIFVD